MIVKKFSDFKNDPVLEPSIAGAILVIFQACGLSVPSSGWGLDPSWVWTTEKAAQSFAYGHGLYIWTYGPLSFLDYQQNFWFAGRISEIVFRSSVGIFFYYAVASLITKRLEKKKWSIYFVALVATTIFYTFNTPSIMLMVALYVYAFSVDHSRYTGAKRKFIIVVVSSITVLQFYTKVLQFIVVLIIVLAMLTLTEQRIKNVRDYLFTFSCLLIISAAILHFTPSTFMLYVRGSYELTIGYKAMGFEEHHRLLEYPSVILLLTLLFYKIWKSNLEVQQKLIIVLTNLLLFDYGFTRHDGHSICTFMWVSISVLIVFSGDLSYSRKGLAISLMLSFLFLFTVSQFSILSLLDVTTRVQQNIDAVRNLAPQDRNVTTTQDRANLKQNANLPQSMLMQIGRSTVSILPFDQLTANAYELNLSQPPIPQFYSAYTPWLDHKDANFYSSQNRPKYILEETPTAIDGRNPIWEAPQTELEIFCHYSPVIHNDRWLLLTNRIDSICRNAKPYAVSSFLETAKGDPNSKDIYLFSYERETGIFNSLMSVVFKPFHHDLISSDIGSWTVVPKNNQYLLLSVPHQLDYPASWSLNKNLEIISRSGYRFQLSTLSTKF